jgi:hypothetical protein
MSIFIKFVEIILNVKLIIYQKIFTKCINLHDFFE